jgi:hypothetical protein
MRKSTFLLRVWIRFATLPLVAFIAFTVITTDKLSGEFSLDVPCLGRVLILAAFVVFLRQLKNSFPIS